MFIFTAALDDASLDPQTETELTTAAGVAVPYDAVVDAYNADLDAIYIFPTGTWRPGDYIAKIKSGAMFFEVNGGEISFAADVQTSFSVSLGRIGTAPAANGIVPTTGGSLVIRYNDTLDVSTVTADEFELVDFNNNPVPFGVEVITDDLPNDAIEVTPTGTLAPTAVDMPNVARQRYTLRLKSSSSFANAGGKVSRGPFALSFRVQ